VTGVPRFSDDRHLLEGTVTCLGFSLFKAGLQLRNPFHPARLLHATEMQSKAYLSVIV